MLELRLVEQGFEVRTVRSADEAKRIIETFEIHIVVGELDLPQGDGLALLAEVRKMPKGRDLIWVVHTRRSARADAQRAFELGVADFVAKPAPTDIFVAKLKALIDTRPRTAAAPRGVNGSLKEMGLPELVQVLFHGRKTGSLNVRRGEEAGEIHFEQGAIVHAMFGAKVGEEAFYAMLRLDDGDFEVDPEARATTRTINQSAEAMLLEGMRRLDEGI